MEDLIQVSLDNPSDYKEDEELSSIASWSKISDPLSISVWVIIKIRKTRGIYVYQEIASEKGDWEDLVCALWTDYKQFTDRLLAHMDKRKINNEIEKIASELENSKVPYRFWLPDFTDDLHIGFIQTTNSRVLSDGTVIQK